MCYDRIFYFYRVFVFSFKIVATFYPFRRYCDRVDSILYFREQRISTSENKIVDSKIKYNAIETKRKLTVVRIIINYVSGVLINCLKMCRKSYFLRTKCLSVYNFTLVEITWEKQQHSSSCSEIAVRSKYVHHLILRLPFEIPDNREYNDCSRSTSIICLRMKQIQKRCTKY